MTFGFATAANIRFGRGVATEAAAAALRISDRVLVVHGRNAGRAGWLLDDLRQSGASVDTIACPGEPDLDLLVAAVATAKAARPGVIVALGGGSAIDLGKAVSALVPAPFGALTYLEIVGEGRPLDASPLPFLAIPTTAGTGAEVTKNAVIAVPAHRRKVSLRDQRMIPDIAFVDPALTDHAPRSVTFSSGLDALTQVIEPYLSTGASPLTDALCRDAIPRGLRALIRLADTEDGDARDDIALTSLFGGMALANAGLGAVHGLAGVIGGSSGAPHGELCATLLPHVLDMNAQRGGATPRMIAVQTWIAETLRTDSRNATRALESWIAGLGIRRLGAMGVDATALADISAAAAFASSSRTNPVKLDQGDLIDILQRAL